jgi:capsular polysaccharide biosynthesis protein
LVILGDAVGGKERSFPIWSKIIGLSAAFGLALGIVLAVLTELYARRIRGPEDLRFASKVPVMAVIADRQPSPWRDRIRGWLTRADPAGAPMQPAQ